MKVVRVEAWGECARQDIDLLSLKHDSEVERFDKVQTSDTSLTFPRRN